MHQTRIPKRRRQLHHAAHRGGHACEEPEPDAGGSDAEGGAVSVLPDEIPVNSTDVVGSTNSTERRALLAVSAAEARLPDLVEVVGRAAGAMLRRTLDGMHDGN